MDRDVVNALHYLLKVQKKIDCTDLHQRKIIWCEPDTPSDLQMFTQNFGAEFWLSDELIRFLNAVEDQLANLPKPDFVFSFPLKLPPRQPGEPRPCFVSMPYGPDWFEPVKQTIISAAGKLSAVGKTNFNVEVSKDLAQPGTITDQIWYGIRSSDVVVADVTDNNPNVFYELGLAHALGKEVIVITQPGGKVPFNISISRFITYTPSDLALLEDNLVQAFKSVTARYPYEGGEPHF
jgi:hypothetical protein